MGEESFLSRVRTRMNGPTGRWIAVGLCGALLLAVGGLALHSRADPERARILKRGRRVLYVCRSCGATGESRISFDTKFPLVCPKCKARQAFEAFRCLGCGRVIESRPEPLFYCPYPDCNQQYDNRTVFPAKPDEED